MSQKCLCTGSLFICFFFLLMADASAQYQPDNDSNEGSFRRDQTTYNLPLVIIETGGREIPKEAPRITAEMGIVNNSNGMNSPGDDWNEYSGQISIKIRGETSSNFPKKSFTIELQKPDGSNNNVSILGLPEENDFVIYGPHSDKTMIKNVLTFELFRRAGHWAPRTRYVEVFVNGDYRGISVLMESIKRDEERVDIDKLNDDDITGGYLLRRDKKGDLEGGEWWTNPVDQPYHEQMWYEYFDPEIDELSSAEAKYIKDWMRDFDRMMSGNDFDHPETGYDSYIKTKSFVDMMFINEISKGIDNYLFSTYFHKESDEDGGQFAAGPPWDYNLSYGNLNYGDDWDAPETYGWCYTQGSRVYWFERLMEDDLYENKAMCRWSKFRADIYSDQSVMAIIDSCVFTLGPAIERNFEKFDILGEYVWPAKAPYPETYSGEVEQLKDWLLDRLAWMDDQWLDKGNCSTVAPTNFGFSEATIDATSPPGSLIGKFSIEDDDNWDHHKYKFVSGEGDKDNDIFYIENNLLYSVDEIDPTRSSYTIRVRATDTGGNRLEKSIDLQVINGANVLTVVNKPQFKVFPNPSTNSIQLDVKESSAINVVIYKVSGVEVYKSYGTPGKINKELLSLSEEFANGVYVIRVSLPNSTHITRFIKH